jgi:hypothetical protein
MRVQKKQCKTCIFRSDVWPPERLAELLDQIRDPKMDGFFDGYRLCHHSNDAVCAGFWARHKDDFALGQIAQRLAFVEFVEDTERDDTD